MLRLSFVPASKMRLRRGLGYPTQITVPYVFTACNPTLQKNFFTHAQKLPKSKIKIVYAFSYRYRQAGKCRYHRKCHFSPKNWKKLHPKHEFKQVIVGFQIDYPQHI